MIVEKYHTKTYWLYTLFHLSEPGVGTMPVHHLRMLDRHRANYNKYDTVSAQLLYHLNTSHINASVSRVGTTLDHHLQMLAQRRTNDCAEDPLCYLYFDPSPNNHRPPLCAIGPQRWFNAGPTLLVCIMNKTLAQHWVNASNSVSFIYKYALLPVDLLG